MNRILFPLLPALAMSVGWGFRGDYGHEAGAMVPGALVALAICLASGRGDWQSRASVIAALGAIGWAFGGQMSYGKVVGYTAAETYLDVTYGYGCLFLIGALWGGIGAGILALGLTLRRSLLERFVPPLALLFIVWMIMDCSGLTRLMEQEFGKWAASVGLRMVNVAKLDWVAATSAFALAVLSWIALPNCREACRLLILLPLGWMIGAAVLLVGLDLQMTPPRSDNWTGCVGLFVALLAWLAANRNRAAISMACYGFLAGGIGFALGDFANMLGRGQWGPLGEYEVLKGLDYWKWMEQSFGLWMGLGVALGFRRFVVEGLAPPEEDEPTRYSRPASLAFVLIAVQWLNLHKNVRSWTDGKAIQESLFSLAPQWWFFFVGVAVSLCILLAIVLYCVGRLPLAPASPLGRTQLLFLFLLWVAVIAALLQAFPSLKSRGSLLVHTSFWLTAACCTIGALVATTSPSSGGSRPATDVRWLPGLNFWIAFAIAAAMILLLGWLTVNSHKGPLGGAHRRFPQQVQPPKAL